VEPKSPATRPTLETVPSRDVGVWANLSAILHGDQIERFCTLTVGVGVYQVPTWICPHKYSSAKGLGSWDRSLDGVLPRAAHSKPSSLRWEPSALDSEVDDAAQRQDGRHFTELRATMTTAQTAVLALHKGLPSQILKLHAPRYEDGWKWLGDMFNKAAHGVG
jgi:hypothetical protein